MRLLANCKLPPSSSCRRLLVTCDVVVGRLQVSFFSRHFHFCCFVFVTFSHCHFPLGSEARRRRDDRARHSIATRRQDQIGANQWEALYILRNERTDDNISRLFPADNYRPITEGRTGKKKSQYRSTGDYTWTLSYCLFQPMRKCVHYYTMRPVNCRPIVITSASGWLLAPKCFTTHFLLTTRLRFITAFSDFPFSISSSIVIMNLLSSSNNRVSFILIG